MASSIGDSEFFVKSANYDIIVVFAKMLYDKSNLTGSLGVFRRFFPRGSQLYGDVLSARLDSLRERVEQLCGRVNVPTPGEFLASIMSGVDPRPRCPLLVHYVRQIRDEVPQKDDWDFIRDLILDSGKYDKEPVTLEESIKAAEKLMDFLHAKLKAVEIQQDINMQVQVAPLTDDEIRRFKMIWSERFE